ncbi:Fc.00g113450.m01.CDS01 [Cosmosporella sp. VM-42]
MTSSRPRGEVGSSFASRRGHGSQLSISDPSHHVTEAIGTLYGDEDDSGSEGGRPMSFVGGSPYQEQIQRPLQQPDQYLSEHRRPMSRSFSDQPHDNAPINGEYGGLKKAQTLPIRTESQRSNTFDQGSKAPMSPTLSLRDVQADPSGSQFPLTNIDNPNDIAQELSNLQALRRLSMDVGNNKDPDMPPMSLMAMPAVAPSGDDDENDPSRLLWVPARVHPELAPSEFKSFLENRVHSLRRRSGDSFLSADGDVGSNDPGSGSLRRQKSKLSRQIDNSGGRGAAGYVDGAEKLGRQRSRGHRPELSLDELVKDPTKAVQKLTQDSQGQPIGPESSADDMPILPAAPGMGLRRSTRTQYRKGGSLRSGERIAASRRAAHRYQDSESADSTSSPLEAPKGHTLSRVQSEPLADNYSRPNRSVKRQGTFSHEFEGPNQEPRETGSATGIYQDQLSVRPSSQPTPVPVIETTTAEESADRHEDQHSRPFPQRTSSQNTPPQPAPEPELSVDEPPPRSSRRTANRQAITQPPPQQQYTSKSSHQHQGQSLNHNLTANPSPLPGGGATSTDSLTFIPTLTTEEKKPDKKSKKDRDEESAPVSTKGSAWKWFKSGTDDKEKKKEESRKSKTKSVDKTQDSARLDVIQNSIDKNAVRGRESLVLDRDNMDNKLQEERKKESHRKSDSKREKDGSIFSSIFGGSKKKEEKEKSAKKAQHLKVPEEPPPYKPLIPDVDYNWTRFPLLEERAIYRMAHIKLANPRRSLLSQVLLSNFMYSYLAIVQAMHPTMNVPVSPQQKRLEEEARRKQQEQEYLAQQQQDGQDDQETIDQYNYDYHRAAVQYAETGAGEVDYVDDAQIYEDEHGTENHDNYNYEGSEGYDQGVKDYYQYQDGRDDREHDGQQDGRDDMW